MLRHCKAQAYLEFLIVLPGLLLLLFLGWEFAYFWYGRLVVSTGTFEAARTLAVGQPPARGYDVYGDLLGSLGRMGDDYRDGLNLTVRPDQRSVQAQANLPWQWPSGLGALLGGDLALHLKASAFFRLEEFYPGPPGGIE
jgi:hypothetical protein